MTDWLRQSNASKSLFKQANKLETADNSTIYVRTDKREFTFNSTLEILKKHFPNHSVKTIEKPLKKDTRTQTKLYGDQTMKPGEVDIILSN